MSKNKEFEQWMQGVIYASNIAVKEGPEALKAEIKRRNITKLTSHWSQSEMRKVYSELGANVYNNMLASVCFVLMDTFEFTPDQLKTFKEEYDKAVASCLDLDYMGEHYVTITDYAVELNEKYNMGIDVNRIAACGDVADSADKQYHMVRLEHLIDDLRRNGLMAAAQYLEKKVEK